MEKSIENIWNEGFLKNDALVAPKINNLYTQKSIHIIDKFKRMFRINLIAIVAFSFIFLMASYLVGIPLMGAIFFITLMAVFIINTWLLNDLKKIDKGENSYQYLKAFNLWVKKQVAVNKRMSAFLYPVFFMSIVIGFWFKDIEGMHLGEKLVNKIVTVFPDTIIVYGIPLTGIVIVCIILVLLSFLGGRIYLWDLNVVYGRVFKKLDELLTDLEILRS